MTYWFIENVYAFIDMPHPYVLIDKNKGGWHYTSDFSEATKFSTFEQADKCLKSLNRETLVISKY